MNGSCGGAGVQPSLFGRRKVKHVADQHFKFARRFLDAFRGTARIDRRPGAAQGLRKACYRIQGRAHLVAHLGKEA
jgi:hypothetical protein